MSSTKTLIKYEILITRDPRLGDFPRGDVLIKDGRIAAGRPNLTAPHFYQPHLPKHECVNSFLIEDRGMA